MPLVLVRPEIRYAWRGSSLLVVTPRGEIGESPSIAGYYWREARHLRLLRLTINGKAPWLCESSMCQPDRLTFDYVHPELTSLGGGGSGQANAELSSDPDGLQFRSLEIQLRYVVGIAGLDVLATITNHGRGTAEFDVGFALGADFADLQEVESPRPERAGTVHASADESLVRFIYEEEPLRYATEIAATGGAPWMASEESLGTRLRLAPRERAELSLRITPRDMNAADLDPGDRERTWRAWSDAFTSVRTPGNDHAQDAIERSARDLASFALLDGAEDEWLTPQAGVPLYPALFGRDALTAGWQSAMLDRGDMLDAVLTRLGRLQGTHDDPRRDEERGRIVQQVRSGPLSRLGLRPFDRYYGDFASPFMYVIALAHLYAWVGDQEVLERHWDVARRVLDWARERGDRDGDGYLEYLTRAKDGAQNQGWKDSGDAVVYDDGTPVEPPIASCEVQGYWFAAQQLMAVMSWAMGERADATAYWQSAMSLRERFNRDWWMPDEGFIAMAMDPDKRLVGAPGSNVGHCLASGIISGEHLPRVVGRLFAPDLFSGWGIRTLSTGHAAYDPLSYHRGSVWAVENATIAFGLRRFGFDARALELAQGMFDLAKLYGDDRVPETVGGHARGARPTPGAYPRANTPQLWNASAFPLLIHTITGLQPVAPLELLVVDPVLPSWLPEIVLHGVRLAGASATIRFWRDDDGASHAEIVKRRGTLHLVRQPPLESLTVGWRDRFSALADRVLHH